MSVDDAPAELVAAEADVPRPAGADGRCTNLALGGDALKRPGDDIEGVRRTFEGGEMSDWITRRKNGKMTLLYIAITRSPHLRGTKNK